MFSDKEFLKLRSNLIIDGVELAIEIKRLVKNLLFLHQAAGVQFSQDRLKDIIQGIEMLKAIEIEFKTKKYLINQWIVLISRFISEDISILM